MVLDGKCMRISTLAIHESARRAPRAGDASFTFCDHHLGILSDSADLTEGRDYNGADILFACAEKLL